MRIRKRMGTIATIAALALFAVTYGLAFPAAVLAWDDCPKGLVNDPYPGACRRYVDTNGDNICDLSQSEPVVTTATTAVVTTSTSTTSTTKVTATTSNLAATTTTSGEPPTGDCPLGPCIGCGACFGVPVAAATASVDSSGDTAGLAGTAALVAATGSANTTTTTPSSGGSDDLAATAPQAAAAATTDDPGGPSLMTHYMVSPIAIAFLLIYGVSFVLYKTKRMRIATHRKIWNVLLMATFLITGIFGLVLTIQLDYALPFTIPFNLLFWHVEAGIVMTLISLFHMGWHFNYYRNLVRNSRSKVRAARAAQRAGTLGGRELVMESREQRRTEREAQRGAAAARGIIAQRAAAQPERAARAPYHWTEREPE